MTPEVPVLTIVKASLRPMPEFQRIRGVDMAPAARTTFPLSLRLMSWELPSAARVKTPVIFPPVRTSWVTLVSSLRVKFGSALANGMYVRAGPARRFPVIDQAGLEKTLCFSFGDSIESTSVHSLVVSRDDRVVKALSS